MTDSQQPTRGLMRRVVIRGGPGSGHFGHEGRPGEVGGSQPSDFHSAPIDNSRFRRGSGVYPCKSCGKMTRATGQSEESVDLCAYCYEEGGLENSLADGDITEKEYEERLARLRTLHHRDEQGKPLPEPVREKKSRGPRAKLPPIEPQEHGDYYFGNAADGGGGIYATEHGDITEGTRRIGFMPGWPQSYPTKARIKPSSKGGFNLTLEQGYNKWGGGYYESLPEAAEAGANWLAATRNGKAPSDAADELVKRGGPGSGHFGHEGRPGKVGGSQPRDFHSAEPGAYYDKGIDKSAMEVLMPGIFLSAEDAKWLEEWFAKNTTVVDPTQHETLVGPSGKAYAVAGLGGHDTAGAHALGSLGQKKLDEGGVEPQVIVKPDENGYDWHIETFAEGVGPDGDGWDRDPDGTLAFTFLTVAPGEAVAKVPIKYRIEKTEDGYQIITASSMDATRPATLFKFVYNALEIAGKDPSIRLESEDKAKQFVEAMLFGKATSIGVDVYPTAGEARGYSFVRLPGEALEAVGLDPKKNIVPDYNWTDSKVPPFVAGTIEETAEKTREYFEGRRDKAKKPEPYSLNLKMGRITGEDGILAMGFLRVSRSPAGGGGTGTGPEVGISWNRTAGLTDAQRRVAVKVAKATIEEEGRLAWERLTGYDFQEQNWGERPTGYFSELPDNKFTAAIQGADVKDLQFRSFDALPEWAERLLIQRGGPGSGHFGHEGRPGKIGGSQPSDFHSAEGDAPGFNAAGLADETGIAGSEWSAEDQKWVENWLSENLRTPSGDDVFQTELFIGPSGKPYDVNYVASDGLPFGHEEVGARAFRALVDARHRNPVAAEKVEVKDLTFEEVPQEAPSPQWTTIYDDEKRKVFEFNPYPMEFDKGPVWNFMAYPDSGFEVWHGRLETENYREDQSLLGGTPFVGTAEMMKKRVVEMMFPIVNEWNIKDDIYDYGEITEWRPVAALDPDKPFSVNVRGYTRNAGSFSGDFETLDDAKKGVQDALNKAASAGTIGGIGSRAVENGETAMLALGFMRVSRGGTTSGGGSGFNWDGNVKLTDAQRRVATKIARYQIENQRPEFAWESGVRWGEATEWPSNDFVLALQTTGPSRITERSFLEMSEWARALLIVRGGAGSGHFGHRGRQTKRGGSEPGDQLPKDRAEQMKQAKQDFHSATPTKREPVGAPAAHIGPGYRMNMTADAFSKYRPAVSAALEWAAREFKQTLGGQVEGVTIHDDPVAFIEANNPEMYAESMAKLDEEGKREVEAGLRQDFGKSLASYNPETKQMLVNVGKHIKPDGALDTDSVMESATHEFVHWATFGSGRDEIWKEVKVPQGFKDIFWGPYGKDLIQQEYVARVVSSEMRGSDTLTLPGDIVTLAMTDEDHKNARLLMDKISNAFVAPNLEMPTTLRVSPERLVDVTVPDGLGNFWGRAVPESQLDSLPAGSTVNAIYAMLKGEEAFEEGRTIRPDVLSLNWLDETDPARHPVRQQITKKPRLDDVTVAIRSQDNVLERVLDTIGGALRELMGMKHG